MTEFFIVSVRCFNVCCGEKVAVGWIFAYFTSFLPNFYINWYVVIVRMLCFGIYFLLKIFEFFLRNICTVIKNPLYLHSL